MKKIIPLLLSVALFIVLPFQTFAAPIDDVKTIVQGEYVGEIDGDLESAQSIDEIIEMLDPYSDYFTKEEFEAFTNAIEMTSVGIGVVIEKHEKGILIIDVIEDGSAKKVGIEPGDIIISINRKSAENLSVEEAQSLIVGEKNTKVELDILKANGQIVPQLITRQSYSIPNVTSKLLYGNVGYISLNSFSEDGAQLVINEYKKLLKQGATSFILDLQYNGGGYVSTAEELIGMFPNAPIAYKLQLADGTQSVKAVQQTTKFPQNTRLLVNRFSASASEMTAAALLDQKNAIIYGEKTYGKGTMQGFYNFSDGSVLKLTIAEFFGPKGTVVNKNGVTPHIETTSNPLFRAHYDSIVANLASYKELKNLLNVPTTKTFKITFNKEIESAVNSESVELIELGGTTVDLNITVSNKQIEVKPKNPLKAGAHYALVIHPKIKGQGGSILKTGNYLYITVEE